jgi:hypothetical protein
MRGNPVLDLSWLTSVTSVSRDEKEVIAERQFPCRAKARFPTLLNQSIGTSQL